MCPQFESGRRHHRKYPRYGGIFYGGVSLIGKNWIFPVAKAVVRLDCFKGVLRRALLGRLGYYKSMGSHTTKRRSLAKAVTFRILVILSDSLVIYALTRQVTTTVALTVFTNLTSTLLYFMHERAWDRIMWGRGR